MKLFRLPYVVGTTFHQTSAAAFSTVPFGSHGTPPAQTTPVLCLYEIH